MIAELNQVIVVCARGPRVVATFWAADRPMQTNDVAPRHWRRQTWHEDINNPS